MNQRKLLAECFDYFFFKVFKQKLYNVKLFAPRLDFSKVMNVMNVVILTATIMHCEHQYVCKGNARIVHIIQPSTFASALSNC